MIDNPIEISSIFSLIWWNFKADFCTFYSHGDERVSFNITIKQTSKPVRFVTFVTVTFAPRKSLQTKRFSLKYVIVNYLL